MISALWGYFVCLRGGRFVKRRCVRVSWETTANCWPSYHGNIFLRSSYAFLWHLCANTWIWRRYKTCANFCLVKRRQNQGLWEKFYQEIQRPIPGPLAPGAAVIICIACLYSNQNIDKTVTLLRFINRLIVILATALHLQFWPWLQKNITCALSYSRAPKLPGPGTMYLLHLPLVGPGLYLNRRISWCAWLICEPKNITCAIRRFCIPATWL